MQHFWQRLRMTAPRPLVGVVCVVAMVALLWPVAGYAQNEPIDRTVSFIAVNLLYPVVQLLGNLLVALINILIAVASYNDFINAEAVAKGWIIVRDIANIVFIVVLLVIAIGTILNSQTYRYNKLLRDLVIMAFLVNFSKFIAGIAIDVAQIIMLTFVSAFRNAAAGNLTAAFGLRELLALRAVQAQDVTGYTLVGSMLLAMGLLTVAVIVVGFYVIVFLIRIVALWLLVVLSPLAYALRTFPQGQKYASEWWDNFTKYVICGPVLAFFLWLSLSVVAVSTNNAPLASQVVSNIGGEVSGQSTVVPEGTLVGEGLAATITQISRVDNLLSFLVAILLLLTSLTMAQRLCGAAGKYAGAVGARARRAALIATGGAAAIAAGRAGWRAGGSVIQQTREGVGRAASQVGNYLRNAGRVIGGNISGGARRGTNRMLGAATRGRVPLPEAGPGGIRGAVERRIPTGLRFNAIAEERAKLRQEGITRAQQTARRQVANRVRGLPINEEAIARREAEAEFYTAVSRQQDKAEFFKYLDQVQGMTGDRGHAARSVGAKYAVDKGWWNEYAGRRAEASGVTTTGKQGVHDYTNKYFANSSEKQRAHTYAELSALAEKNNNFGLIGIGKAAKDVGDQPEVQSYEKAVEKTLDFQSKKTSLRDALQALGNNISTKKMKPYDLASYRAGQPLAFRNDADDIDVPEQYDAVTKELFNATVGGHERKKVRDAINPSFASKIFGPKVNYDSNTGTVFADADTVQNIRQQLRDNPDVVRGAWLKEFGTGRMKVVDASTGNLEYDQDVESIQSRVPGEAGAEPEEEAEDETVALRDVDRAKYERTHQRVLAARSQGQDFHDTDEYRSAPDQYFDSGQYQAIQKVQERTRRTDDAGNPVVQARTGGIARFGTGQSNVLAFNANEFMGGKYQGLAGAFLKNPKAIAEFAGEYTNELQKQIAAGGLSPARQATIERTIARLQKPETLGQLELVNTARTGYSARHVIGHESVHESLERMDQDGSLRQQLKSMMSPEEYQKAIADTRTKMGAPDLKEQEAFTEYITEGLANEWGSWADQAPDALKLRRGLVQVVQERAKASGERLAVPTGPERVAVTSTRLQEQVGAARDAVAGGARAVAGGVRKGLDTIGELREQARLAPFQQTYQYKVKAREEAERRETEARSKSEADLKEWQSKIQQIQAGFQTMPAGPEKEERRKVLRDMEKMQNQRVAELGKLGERRRKAEQEELAARKELDEAQGKTPETKAERRGDQWRAPAAESASTQRPAAQASTTSRPAAPATAGAPSAPTTEPSEAPAVTATRPTEAPAGDVAGTLREINQTLTDLRRDVINTGELIRRFPSLLEKSSFRLDPASLENFQQEHRSIAADVENADPNDVRTQGESQRRMQELMKRLAESLEKRPTTPAESTERPAAPRPTNRPPGRPTPPPPTPSI